MDYKKIINQYEESKYLISMVSVSKLVELGCKLEFSSKTRILDLCCGYGGMLKIWNEAFSITGTGVDRCEEFIDIGKSRLQKSGNIGVTLIADDVLKYFDETKYDIVICTEPLGDINDTLTLMRKFIKPGGKLIFGRLYTKVPSPPKELIDFDGELCTLDEIYSIIREQDYYLTALSTDSSSEWERYIFWSSQRDLDKLRKNPEDQRSAAWIEKWNYMYLKYRIAHEGWALFALEKLTSNN